jgi:hypothetical protein
MNLILILIAIALATVLVLAATRPNQFRIERSALIKAPPEAIFGHINSFAQWSQWSPWEKLDPTLKRQYSGQDKGVGAIYTWVGNKQVGEGRMEIRESTAPGNIVIQLDFLKPFAAHNTAQFTLVPEGDATRVTWAMFGPSPFVSKLMGLFFNLDKMVGKDFEAGLAQLKSLSER